MKKLLLFFLLAVVACTPAADPIRHLHYTHHPAAEVNTRHVPVWFDDKMPQPFRHAAAAALSEWNLALNGYKVYEIAAPETGEGATAAESLQWRIDNQPESILVFEAAHLADMDYPEEGVLGWVSPNRLNVVHILVDGWMLRPDEMRTVIMHEVGHTLGLEHTRHNGLLYPYYNEQPTCIDHLTVQQLAAAHEWDDRRMNWCE